nr:AMIN domain-containing protein [Thioalkalivibrio nitratireducens]
MAVWLAAFCLLLAGPLPAQELLDIRGANLGAEQVQLSLRFSEPPPEARIFVIDSPPRIALDLPGVSNHMRDRTTEINIGPLLSATAVEAGDRTRVILNLARSSDYQSRVEGNELVLTVGRGAGEVDRVARAPEAPAVAPERAAPAVRRLPPARPACAVPGRPRSSTSTSAAARTARGACWSSCRAPESPSTCRNRPAGSSWCSRACGSTTASSGGWTWSTSRPR